MTTQKGSMKRKTLKLLFLDPNRFKTSSVFISELEKIGLKIIYEDGAHPAYIVDTGIELKKETLMYSNEMESQFINLT